MSLDAERRIELASEVFERNCRGQLDDLRLAEPRLQSRKERVVYALAGDRHALGIIERQPLLPLNSALSRQFAAACSFASPSSPSITRTELISIQNGQPLIEATRKLTSDSNTFGS